MIPQRFIQSYKCECFQPYNYCNCPYKSIAANILVENVQDVAATLIEVMRLCGIPPRKAKLSLDVVVYYFLHFEEIIKRIDSIPRKRLSKEDLFHDLHRKCDMQRMEAQMAYSIIKRAFRAFYHGSAEGGVPNPWLRHQLVHTQECMWAHAAHRTAQVYAAYEGMFLVTQKDVESKIKALYKGLYERMMAKPQPDENQECTCTTCAKRIMRENLKTVRVTMRMHKVLDPYEEIYRQIVDKMIEKHDSNSGNEEEMKNLKETCAKRCTCPSLKMSNNEVKYREAAKSCNTGYSQGPYDCRWFGISKEEYEEDDKEPVITLPKEFPCPPCHNEEEEGSSCESECLCNCEVCSCQPEDDLDCGEAEIDMEEGAVSAEDSLNAEEEEALSEEITTNTDSEISHKDFILKYSGCKKPDVALATSSNDKFINPHNWDKKRKSLKVKTMHKRPSSGGNRGSNSVAKGSAVFLSSKLMEDGEARES